jgi:membrane protease YdiL (CAAX protease family)
MKTPNSLSLAKKSSLYAGGYPFNIFAGFPHFASRLANLAKKLFLRPVLIAAIISEGLLVVLSAALIGILNLEIKWNSSSSALTYGLLATVPLLLLNVLLWRASELRPESIYSRFSKEVVIPLCQVVTIPTAIVIAILSGVCEELFFRGALNAAITRYAGSLIACLITSLAFAAVHFIGSFKRYGKMIPLYTAVGGYFWIVNYCTGSLAAVAILHGVYNFIVILTVKRFAK